MSQTTFTALNGAPTFLAGRKVVSKARAAPSKRASFQVSAALQQGRRLWAPGKLLQRLRALLLALVSPKRSHCTRFPQPMEIMAAIIDFWIILSNSHRLGLADVVP